MAKILIGGIVGGLVIFCWGFVSHMFLSIGEIGMQVVPNEQALAAAMKADVPGPGLYFVPGRDMSKAQTGDEMQAHMEKIAKGPYGFMVIYPKGRSFSFPNSLLIELVTNIASALLGAILVSQLRPGFLVRASCVTLVGLLAGIAMSVPYWNWYGFPTDFTVAQIVESVVGWLLAGIALAAIVRPAHAKPVEQTQLV